MAKIARPPPIIALYIFIDGLGINQVVFFASHHHFMKIQQSMDNKYTRRIWQLFMPIICVLFMMLFSMTTIVYADGLVSVDPQQSEEIEGQPLEEAEIAEEGNQVESDYDDLGIESNLQGIEEPTETNTDSDQDNIISGETEVLEDNPTEEAINHLEIEADPQASEEPAESNTDSDQDNIISGETEIQIEDPIEIETSDPDSEADDEEALGILVVENASSSDGDEIVVGTIECENLETDQSIDEAECEDNPDVALLSVVSETESADASPPSDEQPIISDPYFYVSKIKYSFLPEGGDCSGLSNCQVSTTPIQDAVDAVSGGLTPDDGTIYVEGGIFNEDIQISSLSGLTLQGAANELPTTLAGGISIVDSQAIALFDFTYLKTILLNNATNITIGGTDQNDQIDVTLSGSNQVEVRADAGDDEIKVHGSHGNVDVYGGAGNDFLVVDFILDANPADAMISFDGGDDFDTLEVTGGSFDSVAYLPYSPSAGIIMLDGAQVEYTNIEPVNELSTATNASFSGTSSGDTITIADGGVVTDATNCPTGCQTIEIQSPQFENVKFANKTNVTVDGNSGDDTITLSFTKLANGLESLIIKGGEPVVSLTEDADKIIVSGTIAMDGGKLDLTAENITVNANAIVSTRMVATGVSNYESAVSTGNSGNIKLNGSNIIIGNGAKLFAHVENGSNFTAGDIEFVVYEDAGLDLSFYNRDVNSVSITINDSAVLRGAKVELSSTVDHSRILQYTGDDQNVVLNELAGFFKSLSFFAGVAYSSIESTIDIKANSQIFADSFKVVAAGIGNAQSEPSGLGISVAVAYVTNRTKVLMGGQVTTTGDAYFNAGVDNTVMAIADTFGLMGGAAAIAITILDSEATVHITDDANLQIGGNLTVQANTVDRTYNLARSSADEGGMLGIAAAIGDELSVTNALVDGVVSVGKDFAINAHQTTKEVARPILIIPKDEGGVNAEADASVTADETAKWLKRVRMGTGALDGTEWKPSLQGSSAAAAGVLTNFIQGSVIAGIQSKLPANKGTPPFQIAAAVAVADIDKKTTARIGDGASDGDANSGVVTALGSITIQSKIESRPSLSAISNVEKGSSDEGVQGTKFAGSAAITVGLYTNEAKAYINENAQVDAKMTILVNSQALNDLSLINLGRKIKKDLTNVFDAAPTYKSTDGSVKISDEDIVIIEKGHPDNKGIIGDLYKYVGTSPNSIIDLPQEDFSNPGNWKHLGSPSYNTATSLVGGIYSFLNDDIAGIFSDSVTQATAKDGETMSIAFAVSVLDLDHTSHAYIADNARINQKVVFRSGDQHVEVKTKNVNELLKFIGNIELPTAGVDVAKFSFDPSVGGFGTGGGKGAIGVVVLVINYDNDVLAKVGDGARLYADSLNVDANNKNLSLLIGASGGEAEKVGFNGVVFVQNIDSTVYAQVENCAIVTVGSKKAADLWGTARSGSASTIKLASDASIFDGSYNDQYIEITTDGGATYTKKILDYDGLTQIANIETLPVNVTSSTNYRILNNDNASLLVNAEDRTDIVTLAGGVAVSKNIGIGATISTHNLTRDTQAIIGNRVNETSETDAATGSINSSGVVEVKARNRGFLMGAALAAAVKKKSTTIEPDDPLDGASLSNLFGEPPSTDMAGKSGAAIAGDVSLKTVTDSTRAYVRDAGPITASGKDVKLLALNKTNFLSISGAVAIAIADPGKKSAGIAGSFSMNTVTFTTETFVKNSTITAGSLTQNAETSGWVVAVSAGGSGATGKDGIAISGSVSLNDITRTTRANLDTAIVAFSGALTQTATNSMTLTAVGGAFSIGGKLGLGASIAYNKMKSTIEAKMLTSTLNVGGDISLKADNAGRITAITVSLGASKSTGAAGTVSINIIDNMTEAAVENSTDSVSGGAVSVVAQDNASIYSFAGAVGIAFKGSGFGAAFAWNEIDSVVRAKIENSTFPATNVTVSAEVKDAEIWTLSVGAAGGKKTTIAGSVSVNQIRNTVDAHISNNSNIDATGNVIVSAKDDSLIKSLAGQVSISFSGTAIGAAVGVNIISNTVKAYIDNSYVITSSAGNLSVTADEVATIHSISAGASGGNKMAIGGSVSVNILTNTSNAFITGTKPVSVDGTLLISASDDTENWALAGNISISSKAAVGIANVTTITNNTIEAYLGDNIIVTARGNGIGLSAFTGNKVDGKRSTENVKGLAVVAVSFEEIDSFAVAGSGGGKVGVAGSASVSVLNETTKATIGTGAKVNSGDNSGASTNQSVLLRAMDDTELSGLGGGAGLGLSTAGIGAGIDVAVITKTTRAKISSEAIVIALRDVIVEAISGEEVSSISASLGVGKSAGIAGSVSVSVFTLTTEAIIEGSPTPLKGATVKADGSVKVVAEDDTEIDMIAGAIGGGAQGAGVSAAINIPIVTKTIKAYIGKGATVNGLAKRTDGITVKTGKFIETLIPDPLGVIDNKDDGQVPGKKPADGVSNDSYTSKRIVTAGEVVGFKGVAVSAVNQDDIAAWSAGIGIVGQGAGVQFSTAINVMDINTLAYIDDNAQVNQAADANTDQSVMVVAGNDYSFKGFSGGVSAAGQGAAVTPAVFVGIIEPTTKAYIGKAAKVSAKADILVGAYATEEILSMAAAIAGAGEGGAVAGSVLVIDIEAITHAFIDAAATVIAGGNIRLSAADSSEIDMMLGSGAMAGIGGGVGVSVGVVSIIKDTRAFIVANAIVMALGNSPANMTPYNGDFDDQWDFERNTDVHGIVVEAFSAENIWSLLIAGAAGIIGGGVAGTVNVIAIDSDTLAYIDADAVVNGNNAGAGSNQDVYVTAVNEFKLFTILGGIGIGMGGVAGAVDVLTQRNDTTAYIAGTVSAQRDIHVNALATKDIETVVVSVGIGIGGVAGSVGVYTMGGNLDSTYESEGSSSNSVNDPDGDSSLSDADGHASGTKNATMLSAFSDPNNDPDSQNTSQVSSTTASVDASVKSAVPDSVVGSQLNADTINEQRSFPRGTSAFLAKNATVNAGRHIDIDAREHIELKSKIGGIGAGAVGVGIGVGIVNNDTPVTSFVDAGASISAGTVVSTGAISLDAQLDTKFDLTSFVGTGGGAALGAAVAVIVDESDVQAYVVGSSLTEIKQGAALNIKAESDYEIDALTPNVAVGGVSAGASIVVTTLSGDTIAFIGPDTKVGQSSGITIGDVNLIADADYDVEADAWVVSAGMVNGFAVNVGWIDIDADVYAYIGDSVTIIATGDITVKSISQTDADTGVWGVTVSTGVSMGGSFATTEITLDVDANIGKYADINTSGGDITLEAAHNKNGGTTKADAMASGGGLYAGNGAYAKATVDVSVDAEIGRDTKITASDDISILSASKNDAETDTNSITIGGIAVAPLFSVTKLDYDTHTTVGLGVTLSAGKNINLRATADYTVDADSDSGGGGAIGAMFADSEASIYYETLVNIGTNNIITAGETLIAYSQTSVEGVVTADASGGGVGAGAEAGASLRLGSSSKGSTATKTSTGTTISGKNVKLIAETPLIKGKAESDAIVGGLVGGTNSDASINVSDITQVIVGTNNKITGTEVIEFRAEHLQLDTFVDAYALTAAIGGGSSDAGNNINTKAFVDLPDSVVLITRDLSIAARSTVDQYRKESEMDGIGPDDKSGKLAPVREINLEADIVIFSNPHIIWRADGSIYRNEYAQQVGFNTTDYDAGFEVGDIKLNDDNRGTISLDINEIKHKELDASGTGIIKGTKTNLQFAFEYVKIEQHYDGVYDGSTLPLTVNDIDVIYRGTQPDVTFEALTVSYSDDDWVTHQGHGFKNGQILTYVTENGVLSGLTNGEQYYVVSVEEDKFKISKEMGGNNIDLKLGSGSGNLQTGHYFLWGTDTASFTNTDDDWVTIQDHSFVNGQELVYGTTGDDTTNALSGLEFGKSYFVIAKEDNKFKLSGTKTGTTPIDLSTAGASSTIGHYLSWEDDNFSFDYTFDPTTYEETTVELIKHTETTRTEESPIYLQGEIVNPYGSTTITNGIGDILMDTSQTPSPRIHTNDLTLEAQKGKIGDYRKINIEMVQYSDSQSETVSPKLSAEARGNINLALGTRRYTPNTDNITVSVVKMTAGDGIDLLLNGSNDIERKEIKVDAKVVSWNWVSTAGPASVYNFTSLENGSAKDIVINSAVLTAIGSANTMVSVSGNMKLSSGGRLYARITGFIKLVEKVGSILVADIKSTRWYVDLRAVDDIVINGGFAALDLSTLFVDYLDADSDSGKVTLNYLEGIAAKVVLYGDGIADLLYVNDTWDTDNEDGSLANTWLDGINVTLTMLSGFGMAAGAGVYIDRFDSKIEILNIDLGSGKNKLTVRGTTATTTIDMGEEDDILDVGPGAVESAAGITGDLSDTKIHGMGGEITYDDDAETLFITLGAGQDDFTVKTTNKNVHTTVNSGGGNDLVTVQNTGINGILNVYGGSGMDYIVFQDHSGVTTLNGDNQKDNINDVVPPACDAQTEPCPGDDRFFIQKADGNLTVYGGVGADKYFVASGADQSSFTTGGVYDDTLSTFGSLSGNLNGVTGKLKVYGNTAGNGGYKDRLYVYSGSTTTNGVLNDNLLTGLSMSSNGSIEYATVEELHIKLGIGNDIFTVRDVPSGVEATVYGGEGTDTLEVGNTTNLLEEIDGIITFNGEGGTDKLNAHNEGAIADCNADVNSDWACGQMTAIGISGLNMDDNNLAQAHIFYANRAENGTISSTTDYAYLYTGIGADRIFIDSAASDTQLYLDTGVGNDTVRVEATPFGLNPASLRRVDFIAGTVYIYGGEGEDFVIINDSGDDKVNVGQFENGYVSGLGITGAVYFGNSSEKLEIDLGEQNDTFSVRTTPSYLITTLKMAGGFDTVHVGSSSNSLDDIQGKLIVEGELPYSNDALFFNDRGDADNNTYTISTAVTGTIQIPDPNNPTELIDLPVNETTLQRSGIAEIIYLTIEQVSLSAGMGADNIYLKSTHLELDPLGGTNSIFAINAGEGDDNIHLEDNNSLDGLDIRVMIDGDEGDDSVHFDHSSSSEANTLTFIAKAFSQLFPDQTATWLASFRALLNDNSLSDSSTFGSVSLGLVSDPTKPVMEMDVNVRDAELRVLLGDSDDVFRLSGGSYEMALRVDAAGGNDTFNISDDVIAQKKVTLNGDDGDDLVFVDFSSKSPNGTISNIEFNGGANNAVGDTLRFAGDGVSSGTYTPSSTTSRAGTVVLNGNTFTFTGLEPLVVHGLANFEVAMPDALSDLAVETIDLADLTLTNLVLHSVSVDGVISWRQQVKLAGVNSPEPKSYGQAIALSPDGNTLVVGADRIGETAGVVFVYIRSGNTWSEQAKLYPGDRLSNGGGGFGRAVAIDNNLLVIGSPQDINRGYDTGAVYIYRLVNGAWTQEWKLRGGSSYYKFGSAVDVDSANNRIAVSAPGANKVYIYKYDGSQLINKWPQNGSFSGSGEFGTSLDLISNGYILVGAPSANSTGEAYIFGYDGSDAWSKRATLKSVSQQSGERFGAAVALYIDTDVVRAVVGSPNYKGENNEQGAAWVFEGGNQWWNMVARLTADGGLPPDEATHEGNAGDHFGASVALYDNYIAVGAPDYDGNSANQGKVYVFYRHERACGGACDSVTWTRSHNLASSTPAESEFFGKALALNDKLLVVGVPGFNETDASNNITREGIGNIRTYTTDGLMDVNDATNGDIGLYRAEALSGGDNFGRKVIYDPGNKELLVSAYGENKIYVYTNEGLYWRLTQTIIQSGDFGYDMDKDGNNLVVGAPGANKFYLYQRGGSGWVYKATVTGPAGVSRFGASVAIDGSRIAVGAPDTTLWISSSDQPKSGYQLNLGKAGVAFTYTGSGATWSQEKFLMPYDAGLYFTTFTTITSGGTLLDKMLSFDDDDGDTDDYKDFLDTSSSSTRVKFWLGLDDADTLPPGMYWYRDPNPDREATSYETIETTYAIPESPPNICLEDNDDDDFLSGNDGWWCHAGYDDIATFSTWRGVHSDWNDDNKGTKIAPRTKGQVEDTDGADDGGIWTNDSYTDWLEITSANGGDCNCADGVRVWPHPDGRLEEDENATLFGRTFSGLNTAAFGTSVEVSGSKVWIGTGSSLGRQYSVADITTASVYSDWDTPFGNPVRTGLKNTTTSTEVCVTIFGTEYCDTIVETTREAEYAEGSTADIFFNGASADWLSAYASYVYNGFYTVMGDPSTNQANLYEGTTHKATLYSDGNVNKFGHGVAFVSTGHFLVGTDSAGELFNYRQRGPKWNYEATTIPTALPTAKFGASVDIDGYTAVVGAPQYDNRGVAFIFEQDPNAETWSLKTQVEGAGTGTGDDFGSAVALDSGRLIVGAPDANSGKGAAYLFDQVGSSWIENIRIAPTDLASSAHFGTAVDIYKDAAVVGAPGMNATYTFQRQSGTWAQDDKLTGSAAFGSSVAVDETTLIVGAPAANSNQGNAAVYTFDGTNWNSQATLTANDGASGHKFGTSVDLSMDTAIGAVAVVGAPGANSVYTYTRSGQSWSQQQKLSLGGIFTYYTVGAGDNFGFDVAIDKNILVVGAHKTSISRIIGGTTFTYADEGAAFAFGLNESNWQLQTVTKPLFGSDGYNQDYIGYSVAVSGTLALAGAPQWDGRPGNAIDTDGAGYIYITELSAPMTVTLPQAVETIIAGERSNKISGTVDGHEIADISFFDVKAVSLRTEVGSHDDTIRLDSDGLQAYGLQNFSVRTGAGEDTFTIETDDLSLPTEGKYASGNLNGYTEGQPLTEAESAELYTKIYTSFSYDGGVNSSTDSVIFATNSDLTLSGNALVSPVKGKLNLSNVYHVILTAGESDNILRASGWTARSRWTVRAATTVTNLISARSLMPL